MGFLTKLFGTNMAKEIKRIDPIVRKIEALEEEYKGLTDAQLQAKTAEFKERYQKGETLDDLLPEAFATCREAADRVLGLRPYRVQLIGGVILHQGRIAEMKTGEGKTLVATLPAYLNALSGEGVHIVTVNDYLAKRDSDWMGKVYRFLGLTVGLVIHGVDPVGKKAAYNADITYGTNNEFGFDYLRDNMAIYKAELMQRGGLHPHRRGPYPPDHLRYGGTVHPAVHPGGQFCRQSEGPGEGHRGRQGRGGRRHRRRLRGQ